MHTTVIKSANRRLEDLDLIKYLTSRLRCLKYEKMATFFLDNFIIHYDVIIQFNKKKKIQEQSKDSYLYVFLIASNAFV